MIARLNKSATANTKLAFLFDSWQIFSYRARLERKSTWLWCWNPTGLGSAGISQKGGFDSALGNCRKCEGKCILEQREERIKERCCLGLLKWNENVRFEQMFGILKKVKERKSSYRNFQNQSYYQKGSIGKIPIGFQSYKIPWKILHSLCNSIWNILVCNIALSVFFWRHFSLKCPIKYAPNP